MKVFLTFLILMFHLVSVSQTTEYYKDRYLQKKAKQSNAHYSLTTTQLPTGKTISELKDLVNNRMLKCEDMNGEPYGIWITGTEKKELDYNFELNYKDTICTTPFTQPEIKNLFTDNDSIGYIAPKLVTGDFNKFLSMNLKYPLYAKENGVSGKVYLMFTITEEGKIENIVVIKSAHVCLDKEAVRVIRSMKIANPANLKGQNLSICFRLPVAFELR